MTGKMLSSPPTALGGFVFLLVTCISGSPAFAENDGEGGKSRYNPAYISIIKPILRAKEPSSGPIGCCKSASGTVF
jgi:hypothetical protein